MKLLFCIISLSAISSAYAQDKQEHVDKQETIQDEEEFFVDFDLDIIDAGLDNLEEIKEPSEFMVAVRRIFSPMVVFFINYMIYHSFVIIKI